MMTLDSSMVQDDHCIIAGRMRHLITILFFVILSGCAATPPLESVSRAPSGTQASQMPASGLHRGERIARHAIAMVGVPYRYGGATPDTGFDCSGLVYYSFLQSDISVPRTSLEQFRAADKISLKDAKEGDLLFFQDQEKLSHVGIYIGDDRFVHAPTSGRTVSIASLDNPYYQMHLVGVGTLLQ